MEQFVRYLFEYKENQRIRNTGFVKVQKDESKTIVHIHGQGFRLVSERKMMLYVYEMEGTVPVGYYQGMIENINPSIHYILTYSPEDIGDGNAYDRVCGILMKSESGRTFAASWNDMPFHANEMVIRDLEAKELEPTFTEAMVQEVIRNEKIDEESTKAEAFHDEKVCDEMKEEEENRSSDTEEMSDVSEIENNEEDVSSAVKCTKKSSEEEPSSEMDEASSLEYAEEVHKKNPTVHKITRQDIAQLPRCEWKLANNSFLLHGYYNYHYLVLIEAEEGLLLGVPGIYHRQEEKAAQSFGFSMFLPENELENESEKESFGYWCRRVRRRIQ